MSSPSSAPPRRRAPLCYRFGVALPADVDGHSRLAGAIDCAARLAGCAVTFADTTGTVHSEAAAARALRAQGVDGVLLAPAAGDDTVVTDLVRLGIPTVLVDRLAARDDVDQVGTENVQSTAALTEQLARQGHRRIGLLAGPVGGITADERVLGHRLGLNRAGLSWNEDLVVRGGALAAGVLLNEVPSAIVVAEEGLVATVLAEADRRGLRIGDELGLACHSGIREPGCAMSTLATPVIDIGRIGVELLLARIADPARRPQTVRLRPTFTGHGSSVAAASSSSHAPS
ncbi:substrate-binding domain-containing protein [Prauserella cavernicola]|uniref:Substrate-binding domain-containing protein n=1 Tax=Prauserella cavernicola TaxID=2800127 RepID=A0A934QQH7_9PSEU|nr:substrate-binding domain-containing protein [Prauserella cavernicola]MBK1784745.1 substrate-binding domain-containing protein [Prauserella cavernicola]